MIPVLGIPTYNRLDLLVRCLATMDHPVRTLVVVNNGCEPVAAVLEKPACVRQMRVIGHPNAGVAGSWNEVVKLFPAAWWMLANDDMLFAAGDLERMCQAAAACPKVGCFYGNHGASWFAVTEHGINVVGLFDENIYPAYLEDCDWARRADLLKVERRNVGGCQSGHGVGGEGSQTIKDKVAKANNDRTHAGNFEYYRRKWGGSNEEEVYSHPFNDLGWPLWAWRYEPARRGAQQWE